MVNLAQVRIFITLSPTGENAKLSGKLPFSREENKVCMRAFQKEMPSQPPETAAALLLVFGSVPTALDNPNGQSKLQLDHAPLDRRQKLGGQQHLVEGAS